MTTDRKIDMAEPEAPELLPCPFPACGGTAEITEPDSHTHFHIRCVKCGMRGPIHVAGHGASPAEAIAAWNRRSPVAISEDAVERVARAMHEVLGSGEADDLMLWPGDKSWDEPTMPRWKQWIEASEAALTAALVSPAVTAPTTEQALRNYGPIAWLTRGIRPNCDPLPVTFDESHVGKLELSYEGGPANRLWWSEAFPVYAHPSQLGASAGEAGWRTMDSAPKDGTWVLTWSYPFAIAPAVLHWVDGQWTDDEPDVPGVIQEWQPTHWQPSPTGPKP